MRQWYHDYWYLRVTVHVIRVLIRNKTKQNSTLQNDVCLFWKWISAGISIHCGKSYELQLVPESHVSCSTTGATLNRDMLRDPISKRLAGVILLHLFIFHVTLLHCFFVNPPTTHTQCFSNSSSLHGVLPPFSFILPCFWSSCLVWRQWAPFNAHLLSNYMLLWCMFFLISLGFTL